MYYLYCDFHQHSLQHDNNVMETLLFYNYWELLKEFSWGTLLLFRLLYCCLFIVLSFVPCLMLFCVWYFCNAAKLFALRTIKIKAELSMLCVCVFLVFWLKRMARQRGPGDVLSQSQTRNQNPISLSCDVKTQQHPSIYLHNEDLHSFLWSLRDNHFLTATSVVPQHVVTTLRGLEFSFWGARMVVPAQESCACLTG